MLVPEVNVYIPVIGILIFLSYYVAVGAVLYFPLYRWQERFIAKSDKQWFPRNFRTFVRGFLLIMVIWPVFLGYTIKEEIRLRRKGLL